MLQKQFPNGFVYPESTYDFKSLCNRAIELKPKDERVNNDNYNTLEEPIAEFKRSFLPGETKIGHHCNLNDLIKAIDQIVEYYNSKRFSYCLGGKVGIFLSNHVIGYLERFLSKYDADILTQGSGNISTTPPTVFLPCQRVEFEVVKDPNPESKPLSVFPLDQNSYFRLGINDHFFAMAETSHARDYCISFSSSISLMVSYNLPDLKISLALLRADKIASLTQFSNWLHTKAHAAEQEQQIDTTKPAIKMG